MEIFGFVVIGVLAGRLMKGNRFGLAGDTVAGVAEAFLGAHLVRATDGGVVGS